MLNGVRVVDLTMQLAGPYCTWLLGSLGADVIKVERPGNGEPARETGPHVQGESVYFGSLNRNKRSLTLDLKQSEGKAVFRRLIRTADVLIENYRPGVLDRLGFSEDELRSLNPNLIRTSISGFGQTGALRDRPAFDIVVQAWSGMMSVTGPAGGPPVRVGMSIGDIGAAVFAAIGTLAALVETRVTRVGRRIDVSMVECQLALLENAAARYLNTGQVPQPLGTRHPSVAPFQAFAASDGMFVIAATDDAQWTRLCDALGEGGLLHDPRYATFDSRVENHRALEADLTAIFSRRPLLEWIERLVNADVPCAPVQTVAQAIDSREVAQARMIEEVESSRGVRLRFVRAPVGDRSKVSRAAPQVGEHSEDVLRELGYSTQEISRLRQAKVL
jgi:CoA:oxalate CoA-transferase